MDIQPVNKGNDITKPLLNISFMEFTKGLVNGDNWWIFIFVGYLHLESGLTSSSSILLATKIPSTKKLPPTPKLDDQHLQYLWTFVHTTNQPYTCRLFAASKEDMRTCEATSVEDHIWGNYNDISRGHLRWWCRKGIPPKSPFIQVWELPSPKLTVRPWK